MIDLYTWATPNGRKASIMLEEVSLPDRAVSVDSGKGMEFAPISSAIAPNHTLAAIVAGDTATHRMDPGVIPFGLAAKVGRRPPVEDAVRHSGTEWSTRRVRGPGPVVGRVRHVVRRKPGRAFHAGERFRDAVTALDGVTGRRLAERSSLAADTASAAAVTRPSIARVASSGRNSAPDRGDACG